MAGVESELASNETFLRAVQTAADSPFSVKMPQMHEMPERRPRKHLIVSIDDHLVEPPNMFEGRLPKKFAERTPRVVETPDGTHEWVLDGAVLTQIGINAVVGQNRDRVLVEPTRFDTMRPGTFDVHQRIADMDIDGVYGSLCFPSLVGFAGVRLQGFQDPEFGLACMRAWNDWHIEEWVGAYPNRFIACQIPWLNDAQIGAAEIHRNAARGVKAVTFPELPGKLGFAPLVSTFWDPFFAACEETGTIVCVHTGSAGTSVMSEGNEQSLGTLFGSGHSIVTAIEWLHAGIAARYPDIKICLSEGGIGWIPCLMDRLDHQVGYRDSKPNFAVAGDPNRTGLTVGDSMLRETLNRNYWFCTLDDPSTIPLRGRIGLDKIMFEVDYPHADTSWPNTQDRFSYMMRDVPEDEAAMIGWKTAAKLFEFDVPESVQNDPESY
jgi:predicted TIM-barrel fold metal-dependent hydrolase